MSEREAAMPAGGVRKLSADVWVEDCGSGSLRKARALGFAWRQLYLDERCAHDFGWTFRVLPRSRVTFGDALMEGDCPPLTEACWHASRMIARNPFPDSDSYEVKYIKAHATDATGDVEAEGVGVVLRRTSAAWIPPGHLVFAIIAPWTPRGWQKAENPF